MSKQQRAKEQRAREKIAQMRAEEARRRRRRLWLIWAGTAVIVIGAAVGITLGVTGGSSSGSSSTPSLKLAKLSTLGAFQGAPSPGPLGSEGVPVPSAAALAGPGSTGSGPTAGGKTIDGISCQTTEQTVFHIHVHLTIFVNGAARQIPAAIGIPGAQTQSTPNGPFIGSGTCFYWLHTHAPDGIIHIESPVHRTYTLGNFFDEWGQPLSTTQVGPATGTVAALYNGQVYQGNPRDIPLNAHAQIQLIVGKPLIAPDQITFPNGL